MIHPHPRYNGVETFVRYGVMDYPDSMRRLIESLSALPGVGRRGAERFAFFMLFEDTEAAKEIADAIREMLAKAVVCSKCRNIAESDPCWICGDQKRNRRLLCVVESPNDVMAVERSGVFDGLYFVLGALSFPEDEESSSLDELRRHVLEEGIEEVIVATSPTTLGDVTALRLKNLLEGTSVKVSRIAKGVPEGAAVRFASPLVLRDAFRRRVDA